MAAHAATDLRPKLRPDVHAHDVEAVADAHVLPHVRADAAAADGRADRHASTDDGGAYAHGPSFCVALPDAVFVFAVRDV